jgi:hypothetical protein
MSAWMRTVGPILDQFDMQLASAPDIGEVLQVVRPN